MSTKKIKYIYRLTEGEKAGYPTHMKYTMYSYIGNVGCLSDQTSDVNPKRKLDSEAGRLASRFVFLLFLILLAIPAFVYILTASCPIVGQL